MKQISIIVEPACKDPKVSEYVRDLWKTHPENRATDAQLRDACQGRDVPRQVLLDMVRRAERQWSQAENAGSDGGDSAQADAGFNGSLSEGIDSLLEPGPYDRQSKDPWAEEEKAAALGGTGEFMSQQEKDAAFAAIEEAKAEAQREVAAIVSPDPLDGDGPFVGILGAPSTSRTPGAGGAATGATTIGISAPAAEWASRTEPKPAQSAAASEDDPFGDAGTGIPKSGSAASTSAGSPADAVRERAVSQVADDMFGEAGNGSAPPAPAGAKTRQRKPKAALPPVDDLGRVSPLDDETRGGQTEAAASEPEPARVPAGSGDVIDLDDLFRD